MRHSTRIWLLLAAGALLAACNPHEFPIGDGGDPARDFSVRLVFEEDMEDLAVNGQPTKAESTPRGKPSPFPPDSYPKYFTADTNIPMS